MAIEISSGGITKRYRYYPYDALYVDGVQVKEAWFNGVKYYPESFDGYQWMGESSGSTIISNMNCHASFTRRWNWYVESDVHIIRYDRQGGYPVTTQPSSGIWSGVLSYYYSVSSYHSANIDPHLIVFEEDCVATVNFGNYSWMYDYLTSEGQAIYNALASGLSVTGISREFDFTSPGVLPSGKSESDMDINGLCNTGNIMLYCTSRARDTSLSGLYWYYIIFPRLEVQMPIDVGKCDGSEDIILYDSRNPYLSVLIPLASVVPVRVMSSGVHPGSPKPVPFQLDFVWESRSESFIYTLVSQ